MSAVEIVTIVSAITFVLSVATSAFISGTKWGQVDTEVKSINQRLAKIEGMFTLTIRKDHEI